MRAPDYSDLEFNVGDDWHHEPLLYFSPATREATMVNPKFAPDSLPLTSRYDTPQVQARVLELQQQLRAEQAQLELERIEAEHMVQMRQLQAMRYINNQAFRGSMEAYG